MALIVVNKKFTNANLPQSFFFFRTPQKLKINSL